MPVAANETVGSTEGQTIMIIHEADMETTQTIDNSYSVIPGEDVGNLFFTKYLSMSVS